VKYSRLQRSNPARLLIAKGWRTRDRQFCRWMPVEIGAFEDGVLALRAEPNASHFCRWREGSLDATLLTLDALDSNVPNGSWAGAR
jgi:hypothetical protein